ncbi:hypothetical protein F442_02945 [Phytophthora nicotianae P10297]|uniref:Uncharacterized protein n=1 Tax=Phytophthora nicotianae P10297 TaxID=1317064 RepID=W2ZYF0_PHYNI|nr:hypothetical protein F442_02945 [Phytophthora nicotianae P10297]
MLEPTDTGPFVADDGVRRPAWRVTMTILRHSQSREDLTSSMLVTSSGSRTGRPLLSVFRFVRLKEYFVAAPRDDTKFVRRSAGVYLYGQVLTHSSASSLALVDDIGIILEPGSGYVCSVALCIYADEPRRVVEVPLDDVRINHVSQLEFLLGYYQGRPVQPNLPCFDWTWSGVSLLGVADARHCESASPPPSLNPAHLPCLR